MVRVSGNVCFKKNEALQGGGMYSDSTSQLVLKSPVMIDFDGNLVDYGAALNFNAYIIIQVLQLTTSG